MLLMLACDTNFIITWGAFYYISNTTVYSILPSIAGGLIFVFRIPTNLSNIFIARYLLFSVPFFEKLENVPKAIHACSVKDFFDIFSKTNNDSTAKTPVNPCF